jgi:PadR family transcriptional regulator, regulatory protein PadR
MPRSRAPSLQTICVLQALADEPARWRYGYDLGLQLKLKSGSLYPILVRLADRELLEAMWEQGPAGKPPRHMYRLTAAGLREAAGLAENQVRQGSALPRPHLREA